MNYFIWTTLFLLGTFGGFSIGVAIKARENSLKTTLASTPNWDTPEYRQKQDILQIKKRLSCVELGGKLEWQKEERPPLPDGSIYIHEPNNIQVCVKDGVSYKTYENDLWFNKKIEEIK